MSEARSLPKHGRTDPLLRRAWRRLRAPLHVLAARRRLARFHSRPRSLEEVVDAALDLHTKGLVRIKALQTRSELLGLAQRVLAMKPRVVLEIGTAYGGTLFLWSQIASHKVIACDIRHPPYRASLYSRFPPFGSACQVIAISGDSKSLAVRARVREALGSDLVDVLFIDGDHTFEGVTADYENFRPLVRPGGIIVFHDITERKIDDPNMQVHRFWMRLRGEPLELEEIVEDPDHSDGIGILHTSQA